MSAETPRSALSADGHRQSYCCIQVVTATDLLESTASRVTNSRRDDSRSVWKARLPWISTRQQISQVRRSQQDEAPRPSPQVPVDERRNGPVALPSVRDWWIAPGAMATSSATVQCPTGLLPPRV